MIRDLLNPSSGYLDLREDSKGVVVAGISEVQAQTTSEVTEEQICTCFFLLLFSSLFIEILTSLPFISKSADQCPAGSPHFTSFLFCFNPSSPEYPDLNSPNLP